MFIIEINQVAAYLVILLTIVFIGGIALYLKKKFNFLKGDYAFMETVLKMVNHITKSFDWAYEDEVEDIMKYVLIALEIATEFNDIDVIDVNSFKEVVFVQAKQLCEDNGVEMSEELDDMLQTAIDYVIDKFELK